MVFNQLCLVVALIDFSLPSTTCLDCWHPFVQFVGNYYIANALVQFVVYDQLQGLGMKIGLWTGKDVSELNSATLNFIPNPWLILTSLYLCCRSYCCCAISYLDYCISLQYSGTEDVPNLRSFRPSRECQNDQSNFECNFAELSFLCSSLAIQTTVFQFSSLRSLPNLKLMHQTNYQWVIVLPIFKYQHLKILHSTRLNNEIVVDQTLSYVS